MVRGTSINRYGVTDIWFDFISSCYLRPQAVASGAEI